ncbi:MAG: outer membrane lipoprotein-sorting protein [Candidatus Zixiibacteriota bacterium]
MRRLIFMVIASALLFSGLAFGQTSPANDEQLTAIQIVERSQLAFYYQGDDMKAKVSMELIDENGGKRTRILTMLRRNLAKDGDQKYFMYFHEPGDVRRMTFMVWKYPTREDHRWIFVPAIDLIRRIAADDKRSSFVGSDFTYEDISGRDVDSDRHTLLRQEKLGGRNCYVIQSIPKKATEYTKRLSWLDKETFLPLREEYYDAQDELFRIFTADKIEEIGAGEGQGEMSFPTVTKRTMKNVKTGHRTEVTFESVAYNLGLKDEDFSERRMRRPPVSWTR